MKPTKIMNSKTYKLIAKQAPDGRIFAGDDIVDCGRGSCPAVLKSPNGKAIVVGRLLTKTEQAEIAESGIIAFHENEVGVELDPELLRRLNGLL